MPPYQHLPGETPHPERDPTGHMFGQSEVASKDWNAEGWRENELYLYGVDLFNFGYWWEAHAAWEALWQTTGRREAGRFLQGLIQVAAALVQHRAGRMDGARRLASKGLAKLRALSGELGPAAGNHAIFYMGVDVHGFAAATEHFFESERPLEPAEIEEIGPPLLVLA